MVFKVVIIGHSFLSRLSLIRSVAETGCEITVIVTSGKSQTKPLDCYSKYVSHVYFCSRKNLESLIGLLETKCSDPNQKTVLIPDGDDVVAVIDEHKEELEERFLFPHIIKSPSSCVFWMDKTNQKRLAELEGLNVAKGIVIDVEDGHYSIPNSIQYPCYCKPLATMNGGKGGMRRCETPQELKNAIDYLIQYRTKTVKVLVEDYMEIETEYALLGFSDGKEVIIPAILQFLVSSKKNKGIALQGKVMPITGFEELVCKFKSFVLKMGFVGLFDIDFYKSGGEFYFCEMNLRFGGSGYAITKSGVNLPAMMVKSFYGDSIEGMGTAIHTVSTYVNERMCLDDWNAGFITRKEFNCFIAEADSGFIPDSMDTKPQLAYRKMIMRRTLINGIKRMIGKS